MILATTQVEDFEKFWATFAAQGAALRSKHGSRGAQVYRDPTDAQRVWVIFDWDEQGWQSFLADPVVPPVMKAAGHLSKPQSLPLARQAEA